MKRSFFLLAYVACAAAFAAPEDEYFWFKNVAQCDAATVTVRSYCEPDKFGYQANTKCTMQELVIAQPGKAKIRRDLKVLRGEDYLLVKGLTCTRSGGKSYLYLGMDNGGNCDTCESQAIIDLSGRWKKIGARWFASKGERKQIARHLKAWQQQQDVSLPNTLRDREGDDDI